MKTIFSLIVTLIGASVSLAQCSGGSCSAPQMMGRSMQASQMYMPQMQQVRFIPAPTASPAQVRPQGLTELTAAERDFLKNGPKLFTMDDALALSKKNGLPVVCWVSTNSDRVFANPKARAVSESLGKTTIQAVMTDTTDDSLTANGPRVQFSDSDYAPTAKAAFIPVAKLNTESKDKILAFVRGGK